MTATKITTVTTRVITTNDQHPRLLRKEQLLTVEFPQVENSAAVAISAVSAEIASCKAEWSRTQYGNDTICLKGGI